MQPPGPRWIGLLAMCAPLCLAVAGASTFARAQPAPSGNAIGLMFNEGRYLDAYLQLRREAERPGADRNPLDLVESFIFTGAANYLTPDSRAGCDRAFSSEIASGRFLNALPEIVRRARTADVVILNEHHYAPRGRAFALEVARELRPLGYSVLAVEAFSASRRSDWASQEMNMLAERGYATRSSGTYLNEPMFAEFVREAIRLGYRPVSYDAAPRGADDIVSAREEAQAQNINERALTGRGGAKVLIFVGFSHATEVPYGRGYDREYDWMAQRLKRISGIDPLTIDQTEQINPACIGRTVVRRAQRVSRHGDVMMQRDGAPVTIGAYRGAVDLQVIHLPVPPIHRRAAWLTHIGRRPLRIPRRLLGQPAPRLVQAFIRGAPSDAVPVDQVLVMPGDLAPPPLMVPREHIDIRFQDPRP